MLTIKKKLAEQASSTASASSGGGKGESRGRAVKRRVSFRSQLLTEEVRELGEILPSKPRLNPVTLYIHVVCT
jgi:hypothetical protein